MSQGLIFSHVENKADPIESSATKIVEAFGLEKCPKLVAQVASSDINVRINALAVLCEEFRNPYSIDGCVRAGVLPKLAEMVVDPDFTTRVRSSFALHLAATDANGLSAILSTADFVFPRLLAGVNDPSEVVRQNVYNCFLSTTRTAEGVEANVRFEITTAFVEAAKNDNADLKPIVLRALHNIVNNEVGLTQALAADAVDVYITLLHRKNSKRDAVEDEIIAEAARSLGYMCYDGRAKSPALEKGAVDQLIKLMKESGSSTKMKIALTLALMSITITNDGKIQVYTADGIDALVELIYDDNRAVVLNVIKIISNLAVYPKNRDAFVAHSTCIAKLRKLSKSEDALVAKHATAALETVSWSP